MYGKICLTTPMILYRLYLPFYIFELNSPLRYFCACNYLFFIIRDITWLFLIEAKKQTKLKQLSFIKFANEYNTVRLDWKHDTIHAPFYQSSYFRFITLVFKIILLEYYVLPQLHWYDHNEISSYYTLICYSYTLPLFVYLFFDVCAEILGLVYTLITGDTVRPVFPYFLSPLFATSLHQFWGYNWHLLIQQTLKEFSYDPIRQLTNNRALALLSVFIVSGLIHEFAFCSTTLTVDITQTLFFVLHGFIVLAELYFEKYYSSVVRQIPWILKLFYFHTIVLLTSPVLMQPFTRLHWTSNFFYTLKPGDPRFLNEAEQVAVIITAIASLRLKNKLVLWSSSSYV
ncbi:unnamed protein product [Didymodactylos carnosus]|uniref:Wax synthase domain-containing protein n=1 Tax=Didymodactylos carnosus TaxID=1234261 RepID=A0A8S2I8A1_9BILA|nr:unnamed protein product [Didymodactylos carnosus]CAF3729472.1 unnamed protein product [Didymodactylos carnosus]